MDGTRSSYRLSGAFLAIISTHANRAIVIYWYKLYPNRHPINRSFQLFPFIMPSSSDPAHSLTVWNASTSQYTLTIIAIVAIIMVPVIFCYTSFVYIKCGAMAPLMKKTLKKISIFYINLYFYTILKIKETTKYDVYRLVFIYIGNYISHRADCSSSRPSPP
ncbi:cytochrome d ubiquinol oxidase subunit II [Piscirickettsia salmonis]|uniref:cytochrome d ubiquinol oxidase subunit II n=1 Tax=Piscirickettsia salmonis TaxID=1238 RepID=UPI001EE4418F|nr:cytochrome d ubiquinol oxidase subunit II [Piscirickettsia salmonis]